MDRFDRQTRIPNWDQKRVQETCALVLGRDWLGTFTVWALASLGVGEILWLGRPEPHTDSMARWFLGHPCPFTGCSIHDYPFDVEYGQELAWVVGDRLVMAIVYCANAPPPAAVTQLTTDRKLPLLSGTTAQGGWYGVGTPPCFEAGPQEATAAMALAAILADSVRESRCPLAGGRLAPTGKLGIATPAPSRSGHVLLVGAGGIGVYIATLAVALGYRLTLVDFDRVEASNLNRQGLFTPEDAARRAAKATAARDALLRLFPGARVAAAVRRVDPHFAAELPKLRPSVLLSAVDNARTRLMLQAFGAQAHLAVVQGGTSLFIADCYTQEPTGATLDQQMHGALTQALPGEAERERRTTGCAAEPSYVVPGMMAGALMAHRMVQHLEERPGLLPLHWRSGSLPAEERRIEDAWGSAQHAS